MYDSALRGTIAAAISRIDEQMAHRAPFLAGQLRIWMGSLSGSAQPADYFLHPLAFPMLLLPWWVEKACHAVPNLPFLSDLAYSTINGYYYIRLIDNVMDGDVDIDPKLLPASSFFHSQFQYTYQRYFPAGHPFWENFQDIWLRSAEAALQDATLPEIDRKQFTLVAAQKVCAAKIPVAAVCYHHERPEWMAAWFPLVDTLGCWHQMMNDLLGWHKDMSHHTQTYFLSEGSRRKDLGESVSAWVVREGFAWGCHTVNAWMAELKETAHHLQSEGLLAYLEKREALFSERSTQVLADLQHLAPLSLVFEGSAQKREASR